MNLETGYKHEKRTKRPPTSEGLPERSDDQSAMSYISDRGLSLSLALSNGWYVSHSAGDEYTRVVIPATNTGGYVYWQARAVSNDVEKRYRSPKYASGDSIVLVWPNDPHHKVACVVEGPIDALAAAEHGLVGVSVMGKKPSAEVLDHILKRLPGYRFLVVPDSNGLGAGVMIVGALAARKQAAKLTISGYKDLAVMPREKREALFAKETQKA